jgi:preprotein translocase subunit SecA
MSKIGVLEAGIDLASDRPYAERSDRESALHDRVAEFLLTNIVRPCRDRLRNPTRGLSRIVGHVERHESNIRLLSDEQIRLSAGAMRSRLRQHGFSGNLVGECFAVVREAADRGLGQRPYPEQMIGGWGLLQGRLVEMATGEGKSLAATLPACTMALAGYPVHVITVNDYLAQRDAVQFEPLYRRLGLSVGFIRQGMPKSERRDAYRCSVTYCSNKELAFDYLRDRVAIMERSSKAHLAVEKLSGIGRERELVLRGLYFGIVDEADSVFIDEARTPLILSTSGNAGRQREQCHRALELACQMNLGEDYAVDFADRKITLRPAGQAKIEELCEDLTGIWTSTRASEELVTQALAARSLFSRDHQYIIADGKVQIVDESTGRVMPDRSWERGLHQMIEAKEGCEPTAQNETIARLTYQRLFRRYVRLAGMTGTAKEVSREIRAVYGLDVCRIPLHKPARRRYLPATICVTQEQKWARVVDAVEREAIAGGRPVLIGTRSVKASEEISSLLHLRGLEHALLNAKQDEMESEIIAQAGQLSRITVATNMAGRGTDIRLSPEVVASGGMHVILTEYHDSRRIDRQLFGRCARQGDPGSCEAVVSLDDELFEVDARTASRYLRSLLSREARLPPIIFHVLRKFAQRNAERRGAAARLKNLAQDRHLDRMLAFSGRGE